MKTHISIIPIFVCLLCTLTGCGSFDASSYTKACLDANAHGEFTEYAAITQTSEEELKKQYNEMLDTDINYLDAYNVDDETKSQFRELFAKIYGNFKYEVGDAIKNKDKTYTVPVTTYKLYIFKDILEDGETYITEYAQNEINAGRTPTTEDLYSVVVDYMYDKISENLESMEYGEPVTTNITISPDESNPKLYSIDNTELQALLESMIDLENMQSN